MKNIFNDKKLRKQFNKNGYVVVDLLNKEAVYQLLSFYDSNLLEFERGFHSTHFLDDIVYKQKVNQIIIDSCNTRLQELLVAYKAIFGNFMVKEPGKNSIMPLHADWTYVDEDKFTSIAVWCPLIDTNKKNGMLGLIPKSHLLKRSLRGPKIPSPFHEHNQYIIDNFGKLLPLKAGEAVIYNHRLLHFSPPNLSAEKRVAFNLVLVPEKAPIYHFASLSSYPTIYKYGSLNSNFFLNYTHFEKPDETKLEKVETINIEAFSKDYIKSTLEKQGFFRKLLSCMK